MTGLVPIHVGFEEVTTIVDETKPDSPIMVQVNRDAALALSESLRQFCRSDLLEGVNVLYYEGFGLIGGRPLQIVFNRSTNEHRVAREVYGASISSDPSSVIDVHQDERVVMIRQLVGEHPLILDALRADIDAFAEESVAPGIGRRFDLITSPDVSDAVDVISDYATSRGIEVRAIEFEPGRSSDEDAT